MNQLAERAESVRKSLFQKYDKLNELWREAENQLLRMHIAKPVWVDYDLDLDDHDNPEYFFYLGVGKHQGKWRIVHDRVHVSRMHGSFEQTLITDCSAQIRVRAVKGIAKLPEAIVASSE